MRSGGEEGGGALEERWRSSSGCGNCMSRRRSSGRAAWFVGPIAVVGESWRCCHNVDAFQCRVFIVGESAVLGVWLKSMGQRRRVLLTIVGVVAAVVVVYQAARAKHPRLWNINESPALS